MSSQFDIVWEDHEREPRCEPDPEYPEGIDLDTSTRGKPSCFTSLPYPAKRCGMYLVTCRMCKLSVAITTAGRPDDPRSVNVACLPHRAEGEA